MKNYNRIALTLALSVASGSGVVHGSEQGENLPAIETEYMIDYEQSIGNLATSNSFDGINLVKTEETTQISQILELDISELATPTEPATRIGNQVQIRELLPPPPEPLPIPNFYNWVNLAECESGGNWQINTGNGYYGGLQFALSSWKATGGLEYAARPDLASPEQQMLTAEVLLGMQGWGAWPACTRKLGLR